MIARRIREFLAIAVTAALSACQPVPKDSAVPSRPTAAPVQPAPPAAASPKSASPSPRPAVVLPSTALPPGPIYACDVAGARTPIEFPGNVESLCRRHPEMGPCQFERDRCRSRGGRVYTSNGEEVTAAIEAEYDRRVTRVRLQADGPPKK